MNLNWLLGGRGEMCVAEEKRGHGDADSYHRRVDAVAGLLEDMEDDNRTAVLDEIFSRVQEAKRVADLERTVGELQRKAG